MINMFRKNNEGEYETQEGYNYECIVINNNTAEITKFKKAGWRQDLIEALKLKPKVAKKVEQPKVQVAVEPQQGLEV